MLYYVIKFLLNLDCHLIDFKFILKIIELSRLIYDFSQFCMSQPEKNGGSVELS